MATRFAPTSTVSFEQATGGRSSGVQDRQGPAGDGQSEQEHAEALQLVSAGAGPLPHAEGESPIGGGVRVIAVMARARKFAGCAPMNG